MHHHGDAAFDPVDDLLGDFFALVDFHHHALTMGAEGKKSMHAGIQIKIYDRIGGFMIDSPVLLKRHRHRHQDAFNRSTAGHSMLLSERWDSEIFKYP